MACRFTTRKYADTLMTDNSHLSMPFTGDDGSTDTAYGEIQDIISVKMAGHRRRVGARVFWYTQTGTWLEHLPVLQRAPANSHWNRAYPFVWFKDIYAQNVGIWPKVLADKPSQNETLVAVWRNSAAREYHTR
jgi:hypothetical protein